MAERTQITNVGQFLSDVGTLVDYNWVEEERDFEERERDGDGQDGHIFCVLVRLHDFLNGPTEGEAE